MTGADYDRRLDPFDLPGDAEDALGPEFERHTSDERLALMAATCRRWNYGPFPATCSVRMMEQMEGEWRETASFETDRPVRGFA